MLEANATVIATFAAYPLFMLAIGLSAYRCTAFQGIRSAKDVPTVRRIAVSWTALS